MCACTPSQAARAAEMASTSSSEMPASAARVESAALTDAQELRCDSVDGDRRGLLRSAHRGQLFQPGHSLGKLASCDRMS